MKSTERCTININRHSSIFSVARGTQGQLDLVCLIRSVMTFYSSSTPAYSRRGFFWPSWKSWDIHRELRPLFPFNLIYFYWVLFNGTDPLLVFSTGLQVILPEYLQEKFVQSALSYIMCNGEGEYVCRDNQCICQCADEFPQCNCPTTDLQIMENTLRGMSESWAASYKDFENSGRLSTYASYLQ